MRIASLALGALLIAAHAPSQTSAGYTRVEIIPLAVPYGTVVDADFRQALLKNLVSELQAAKLFADVAVGDTPTNDPNTLRLATAVTEFNPGDADVRAGVGLGFGATKMKVRARLLDARTCAMVAEGEADGKVIGGWLGGNSLNATRGVAKDVVKIAARANLKSRVSADTSCDPDDNVTAVHSTAPAPPPSVAALIVDAEQGDATAQLNLANVYAYGKGVPKNEARATKWYQRAAEGGNSVAQTALAIRYEMGWSLPFDEAASLSWIQKGAEQEYPPALAVLGVRYARGAGVQRSPTEAVRYFRASAEAGHAPAMCLLGNMYMEGMDVEANAIDAYRWHTAAVTAGNQACAAYAKLSAKKLSREERATAEREGKELFCRHD